MPKPETGQTILVIDDDVSICKVAQRRLEQEGYRVLTALDGSEGLKVAGSELPNLILLDIMMPIMDGREVLRRLKADPNTKSIPVILLTVIGENEDIYASIMAGDASYLAKPYDPQQLLDKIRSMLSKTAGKPDQPAGS